ncbi:centrosomal protein of 104 kDa-like [Watersipora subatra]|uniref:centrosomal protein of 104 kDa-like n=1 Tax=Watersipora subatra TaxID=2589382 RepID=UPI00355C5183
MPEKVAFHVVHVSGQDDNLKATELNTHSPLTRGWSSSRFCLYPQDIVIQLEKRCRIRKVQVLSHQYLIASRVEFFVGDIPPDLPINLQNARYNRLGYVALSDNEQTDYKARELKSVHVDSVGLYLKLVIHKNHVNKYNLYNQVGVIAINVIGDDLDKSNQEEDYSATNKQKPDYISPLDDLAFDMYQDTEVAQIIRKLERKKQESVLAEKFDYAKRVKQAIAELQKVGEKLGKYEVEKRQAVENEDYDKAKLKKVQMEEYRLQMYRELNIAGILEDDPNTVKQSPRVEPPPSRLEEIPSPPLPKATVTRPSQSSPLPTVGQSARDSPRIQNPPSPKRTEQVDRDDRALPSPKQSYSAPAELEDDATLGGQTDRSDANTSFMTEKDQREAAFVIDVFGVELVQKAYGRNYSTKEECMSDLVNRLTEFQGDKEEAKAMMKAATFLIHKLLKDSVHSVFKSTINALKYLLTVFVPNNRIPKHDIHYTCEKTIPEIMHKTGDTAARTRTEAKTQIIEMSQYPELQATHAVPLFCVRPFKLNTAPRLAQSHVEVVDELYTKLTSKDSGLTVDNLMKFCVNALQHHSGQVRSLTEALIIKLYKERSSAVKSYLPPDDEKTRRNTLYRQLFEAFDVIDGKPSKKEIEKNRQADEAAKKAEVEDLQRQIAQMRALQSNLPANNKKKGSVSNKKSIVPPLEEDAMSTITKFDRTCIFCNEQNDTFTEEGLDLHYWKSCPMLKRCSNCKQVVEIAGLTEHLLTECEAKGTYSKCPRCTEAIPKTEFDEHVKAKACNPADPKKSHCPLCHQNIPAGDNSWTDHLMTNMASACKGNPRRHNNNYKNKSKGGVKPTAGVGKSRIGKSTGRK